VVYVDERIEDLVERYGKKQDLKDISVKEGLRGKPGAENTQSYETDMKRPSREMKNKYCILDCFVDVPACFGVPPFVSPYPRYITARWGDAGRRSGRIQYLTYRSPP
jgi:hypothetical protein